MDDDRLNKECVVFSRYLINQKPGDYVLEKYRNAHTAKSIVEGAGFGIFDNLLTKIAVVSPFFTKLADVYSSIFFKKAVFRKKIILLIAILESSAPYCYHLDSVSSSGKTIIFMGMILQTSFFMLYFLLSIILIMPAHVICRLIAKPSDLNYG